MPAWLDHTADDSRPPTATGWRGKRAVIDCPDNGWRRSARNAVIVLLLVFGCMHGCCLDRMTVAVDGLWQPSGNGLRLVGINANPRLITDYRRLANPVDQSDCNRITGRMNPDYLGQSFDCQTGITALVREVR